MGGDDFNKTDNVNPQIGFSRGDTILSRLNNEWELAKIRYDAAAEYFDELCEMVEFEINTHHNNRNYFMFIDIEFPVNLNQFVPRPESEDVDFLMQKTWSDKFQEFIRKQEINCLELATINTIRLEDFSVPNNLKYKNVQLESDSLIEKLKNLPSSSQGAGFASDLESTSGNYISNVNRRFYYGNLVFNAIKNLYSASLQTNCWLRIESLPEGYFFGLTENEKDSTNIQKRNNNRTKRFLLTWPKHVFVENKSLKNDFRENGRSW